MLCSMKNTVLMKWNKLKKPETCLSLRRRGPNSAEVKRFILENEQRAKSSYLSPQSFAETSGP